jgi:hypothetical protein
MLIYYLKFSLLATASATHLRAEDLFGGSLTAEEIATETENVVDASLTFRDCFAKRFIFGGTTGNLIDCANKEQHLSSRNLIQCSAQLSTEEIKSGCNTETVDPMKHFEESSPNNYKRILSETWCVNKDHGYEHFWNDFYTKNPDFQGTQVEAFGILMTLEPFGFNEGDNPMPYPTACRSGAEKGDLRINGITNTYIGAYVAVDGKHYDSKTGKMVRHGILGYKKVDQQLHEDFKAIVLKAGNTEAIVSLNLLSKGVTGVFDSGDSDLITNQNNVLLTNSKYMPSAPFNFGVNWGGRQRSYKADNYVAIKNLAQFILRQVQKHYEAAPKNNRLEAWGVQSPEKMPNDCTQSGSLQPAFEKLQFGFGEDSTPIETINPLRANNAADKNLHLKSAFSKKVEVVPALEKMINAIVSKDITDHNRKAVRCVLKQLDGPLMRYLEVGTHKLDRSALGTSAPGNTVMMQHKSIRRAIRILLQLAESDMDEDTRTGDILRVIAASTWLGADVWVNCKSGLDRTGIIAPAAQAYQMMVYSSIMLPDDVEESIPSAQADELMLMAVKWETRFADQNVKDFVSVDPSANTEWDTARLINTFQNLVLEIAMKTSLPITYASTGVNGVKWMPGWKGIADTLVAPLMPWRINKVVTDPECKDFVASADVRKS